MTLISEIENKRAVQQVVQLSQQIDSVAVILTSSRSGSSLFKEILSKHHSIASLSGEIEPFLALSRNGFGFTSDSDAINQVVNREELLSNLFDDLGVPSVNFCSHDSLKNRWRKKCLIQFPKLFANNQNYKKLLISLDLALEKITNIDTKSEYKIHHEILHEIYKNHPWRINYYDGFIGTSLIKSFDEPLKIEEPPFVTPQLFKRQFNEKDANNKTLLFKTPQDCHRIGMYETLFPNAKIKYIHLTRGYAQTTNGLMDGWLSPTSFFAHNLGSMLNISGYSDHVEFGTKWWKFDFPPNWHEFINADLINVCANQWFSAHKAILDSNVSYLRVQFEEFIRAPSQTIKIILEYLGLNDMEIPSTLPLVMVTEKPKSYRWRKREREILALGERKDIQDMMNRLGYAMDPSTWV